MLMLEHKGIEYERVELPTGLHPFILPLRGFGSNPSAFRHVDDDRPHRMLGMIDRLGTVPSLLMDGQRIKTNREIARFLDRVRPEPPLFPADPVKRAEVEEAEEWGDEVLQMTARRVVLAASRHGRDALINRANDGRLGPLLTRSETMRFVGVRVVVGSIFGAGAQAENKLMAGLPAMLDRIDAWVETGVLNGNELNAADFMIAPSLALMTYWRDLADEIERRPSIRLVDRLLPDPTVSSPALAA
jgi:glutathione S-transferase